MFLLPLCLNPGPVSSFFFFLRCLKEADPLVHHGPDGVNCKSLIILQFERNPADESTDSVAMASFFFLFFFYSSCCGAAAQTITSCFRSVPTDDSRSALCRLARVHVDVAASKLCRSPGRAPVTAASH